MADIGNIIRQLAKSDGEKTPLVCTVDAVDKDTRTIDCTPINEGAPLLGVNLQANQEADFGLCVFPEVGSFVIVGFIADGAAGVVLTTEKIESAEIVIGDVSAVIDADGFRIATKNMSAHINNDDIVFNGGNLNGLVIIQDLTDKLNNLVSEFNAFVKVFNSHIHTTTATIGPGTIPGVLSAPTASASDASNFSKDDYENTKIKQ